MSAMSRHSGLSLPRRPIGSSCHASWACRLSAGLCRCRSDHLHGRRHNGEDVSLGAIPGRAGFKTNTFFGVEGEFAIGIGDGNSDVLSQEASIGLDSAYGVFAVGWLPIPLFGDLFGCVGYADRSIEADAGGLGSVAEDSCGPAYGSGIALRQIPCTKLRLEYTRYEPDNGEIDSFCISALFQFEAANAQRDLRQHGPPARRIVTVSRTCQTRGPHTTVCRNHPLPRASRWRRAGLKRHDQA